MEKKNAFAELLTISSACRNAKLFRRNTTIGRKPINDIQVDNPFVSGQHVRILRVDLEGDEVLLQDISTNGCYVNGKRVGKNKFIALSNGDQISLTPPPNDAIAQNHTDHIAFIYRDLLHQRTSCIIVETDEEKVATSYDVVKELGAGTFGKVFLAVDKENQHSCALKCIDKRRFQLLCSGSTDGGDVEAANRSGDTLSGIFEEVRVLNRLSHPNIVRVLDVMETPRFLVIALDLATGGDLEELLSRRGRLVEKDSQSLVVQIFNALAYLHEQDVVHRDLKPANVLIKTPVDGTRMPRLLLTDFGLSRVVDSRAKCTTICGTPLYVAPEVALHAMAAAPQSGYDHRVDMWSAGMILYEMVCGHLPVAENAGTPLVSQILAIANGGGVTVRPPSSVRLSDHVVALLHGLLTHESRRLSAREALESAWFTSQVAVVTGEKRKSTELSRQVTVVSTPSSQVSNTPGSCPSLASSTSSQEEETPIVPKRLKMRP